MLRKLTRDPVINGLVTLCLAFFGMIVLALGIYLGINHLKPITRALETTIVSVPVPRRFGVPAHTAQTTWAKQLKKKGTTLYFACRLNKLCNSGLRYKPFSWLAFSLDAIGVVFLLSALIVALTLEKKRDQLDDAKWLRMDPDRYPEIDRFTEGGRDDDENIVDPVIVKLGYVVEPVPPPSGVGPGRPMRYKYVNMKTIGLTSSMFQEHVLVYGPTGTGKTSRVLWHMLIAFAKRGDAVVVIDFKYPKIRGGFKQAIALFKRMGQPVYPILPYARGGYHIPIFDFIKSAQEGRDVAAILMPKQEYGGSSGSDHWKETQQIILGTVFEVVAASPTPNFAEVIRIMQMGKEDFMGWLGASGNPRAIMALQAFMDGTKADWSSFTVGIRNALEAFDDDAVCRTFTSVEGRNFDPVEFATKGGLLYFGQDNDKARTKRAENIVRVFDNWLVSQLVKIRNQEKVTGKQRSIRLMYDEAPNLGRLNNILRSVGTLRDSDIGLIFGIQNESQMELAYDDKQWAAIVDNLGTHIILPTGFKDKAAITLSKYLGEREIRVQSQSNSRGVAPLMNVDTSARSGQSVMVQKRPLATPVEISEWPYFMGILRTKGTLPPALIATVPVHLPRAKFYGLDGRRFQVDNKKMFDGYLELMDDLTDDERDEEVNSYIDEFLTDDDRKDVRPTTMIDVFNEWIRYAISDGAQFRRTSSGRTWEFLYPTLHPSLRNRTALRAIHAFVVNGWIRPGAGMEDSPQDWNGVEISELGLNILGPYAQKELASIRFTSVYIQARKRIQERAPGIGATYEEAREILPVDAARDATIEMLRTQDSLLDPRILGVAADLIMARFKVVPSADGQPPLVAIPLSLNFKYLIENSLAQAQGQAAPSNSENATWNDRVADPSKRATPPPAPQVPAAPAPAAPSVELGKPPLIGDPVQMRASDHTPPSATPDVSVPEDEEGDEQMLPPRADASAADTISAVQPPPAATQAAQQLGPQHDADDALKRAINRGAGGKFVAKKKPEPEPDQTAPPQASPALPMPPRPVQGSPTPQGRPEGQGGGQISHSPPQPMWMEGEEDMPFAQMPRQEAARQAADGQQDDGWGQADVEERGREEDARTEEDSPPREGRNSWDF